MPSHLESPYRTGVQCKGFAPAAPRRARNLVSDSVSGFLLSQPVPIMGTVGRYPTVYLIGRSLILQRLSFGTAAIPGWQHYSGLASVSRGCPLLKGRLATCYGAIRHGSEPVRLAWLNRTPIAMASGRINRNVPTGRWAGGGCPTRCWTRIVVIDRSPRRAIDRIWG